MATQLQLRRGTEAENDAFTGAQGEVTVDTTNNHLRVHDGTTSGGYKVANIGDEASKDLDNLTTTGKANISTLGTYDENETYASGTVGAELAKIASKADTDLSNITSTGKENISKLGTYDENETYSAGTVGKAISDKVDLSGSWGTPSTVYETITPPAVNTEGTYTAPEDGYVNLAVDANANAVYWVLNKSCGYMGTAAVNGTGAQQKCRAFCPLAKGQQAVFNLTSGSYDYLRFYYLKKTN